VLAVMLAALAGCSTSAPAPARSDGTAGAAASARARAAGGIGAPSGPAAVAPPAERGLPDGLVLGLGNCPDSGLGKSAERTAQASLPIPLETGLTLSAIWSSRKDDYDHECLTQIDGIYRDAIDVTTTCQLGADRHMFEKTRELCRADLRRAYMYMPQNIAGFPDIVTGQTMFSLSQASFRELKSTGRTRHRFVQFHLRWRNRPDPLNDNRDMTLVKTSSAAEPYSITVNDRQIDVPVLRVAGEGRAAGGTHLVVVDQDMFPLVLEYGTDSGFSLKYTKISFPTRHGIEQHLATDRHVDVYGIYFDFASDRLRPESRPILQEIAAALVHNPDWTLSINGHTDSVGGDLANLDLSRRRADAVRDALATKYGIDPSRLSTRGFGASQPKDTNDTPEGRARNRRVELVRR
jgi:hypothetical protein